jgi:hypothetical protein
MSTAGGARPKVVVAGRRDEAGKALVKELHDSYRPFGAGPLTWGNFARAVDGLDPRDKDSPKVTFTTTSIRNRLRFSMLPP